MNCTRVVLWAAVLTAFGCGRPSADGPRETLALEQWEFCPDATPEGADPVRPRGGSWEPLTVPHVFRMSGLHEESAGWYRQTFYAAAGDRGRRFWLLLEGAGSVADVYVGLTHVGRHRGAYTAAAFDLTPAVRFGRDNELLVRVSNRPEEAADCLSQSNLYYTNGGLYRPAWLVKTGAVHIHPELGSTGVYLTPRNITGDGADLLVETVVRNTTDRTAEVDVRHSVTGPDGLPCASFSAAAAIPAGAVRTVAASGSILRPKLWDIGAPNLYTVRTEVFAGGRLEDALAERTGLRTVAIDDGRFMLNGRELLVRGVCKHHQSEHTWNAMSDAQLRAEWDGMTGLGVNTVRLAHYPHRRLEYSLADERGVAVWAENGLAGQKWDRGVRHETAPNADGERITREMVRQNWNHPSILFWSSGNETYQEVASHYADVIRREDATRLVTYASAGERPANVDFVAGNTYQGWYYARYSDFARLPENAYISETGAGAWPTHHVPYGTVGWDVDRFEPEEYCELFAEFRFQTVFGDNPSGHKMFLWWNFREFYNKKFKGNRNTKGIWTLAGMPKDYYYLLQSFLRPGEPVLHLCGRHHFYRQFEPGNGIKAYSNARRVWLRVNGEPFGEMENGRYRQPDSTASEGGRQVRVSGAAIDNVFFWKPELSPGKNVIEVQDDRGGTRSMVLYQKAPGGGPMPEPARSIVAGLRSSNPDNPAFFADRPAESQGPFYYEADGSSDNTFDALPEAVAGAGWIATRRLSLPENRTDLEFRLTGPADVYVMYATGTFPAHTLKEPDREAARAAAALRRDLSAAGFADAGAPAVWRGHDLWLADCGLLRRAARAGDAITIPGRTLDYVVLVKPRPEGGQPGS